MKIDLTNYEALLEQARSMFRRECRPPLDPDELAQELVIELWTKHEQEKEQASNEQAEVYLLGSHAPALPAKLPGDNKLAKASNGQPQAITWLRVRQRVIDEVRRIGRREEAKGQARIVQQSVHLHGSGLRNNGESDSVQLLSSVLEHSNLSRLEERILYHRYYQGRTDREIATIEHLSTTQVSLAFFILLERLKGKARQLRVRDED